MDYKKVLERMGFVDNKDFSVATDGLSFSMLQQSRMINQVIPHALVPAVYDVNQQGAELTPFIPAVLDVDGVTVLTPAVAATYDPRGLLVTPEVPAYDEVVVIHHPEVPAVLDVDGVTVLTPAVAAYDEYPQVAELYTLPTPTVEAMTPVWEQIQVEGADIVLLIEEYLKGKENLRDPHNDSLNTGAGVIYHWGFANIPQPTISQLAALVAPVKTKHDIEALIASKQALGSNAREKCSKALDVIAGYNAAHTSAQIDAMVSAFTPILTALQMNRPFAALALVQAVTPDGVLVTQEMKDIIVSILS